MKRSPRLAPNHADGPVLTPAVWIALIGTGVLLAAARTVHYLLFHTLAEVIAIAVSISIFTLTWATRRHLRNGYLVVLGAAYATIAIVDVFHTLTFKGMALLPGVTTNHPTQFWLTARMTEAVALLVAPLLVRSEPHFGRYAVAFAIPAAAVCAAIYAGVVPPTHVEGLGLTAFKVGSEFVIIGTLAAAQFLLWRRREDFPAEVFRLLSGSLLLAIATELCFVHYVGFYDFVNELGHYFRFASVVFAYLALVVTGVRRPADLLYRELVRKDEELERINTRLAASEADLNRAQAVAGIGSWTVDIDTGASAWSDQTYHIFGAPRGTPRTPTTFMAAVHPDDAERVRSAWSEAVGSAARFDLIHRIVAGERVRWVRERAEIVRDAQGRATTAIGTVQDITAQKATDDELEAYRKRLEDIVAQRTEALSIAKEAAETASRAKTTFLATMSHELRTPIHAIMGMANLVRRRASDPRQADQVTKIERAAEHLLAIINDILDTTRIEAERMRLDEIPFSLREVFDNLDGVVRHPAAEKRLHWSIEAEPALANLSLLGDPKRLGQILANLAGNAIKFTDAGSVTLRTRVVEERGDAVLLRFDVIDTGIGLTEDEQRRLFTAFEQVDGSLTRRYGGIGLGLAISRRLARLMGGDIGVDSRPGAGSTFTFTVRLPKADAPGSRPGNADAHADVDDELRTRCAGKCVLLVEDEPLNREVTLSLLQAAGLAVDTAEDGYEAVFKARMTRYDLVLMDMQMPRMNGVDATLAIRALPGCEQIPIVALTANAFPDDRKQCLAAGMNDFLAKPVPPRKLAEAALKWLRTGTGTVNRAG